MEGMDKRIRTMTEDFKFYVENLESQVEGWLKKERRSNTDQLSDLSQVH